MNTKGSLMQMAEEDASALGASHVSPVHLLLALSRIDDPVGRFLSQNGISHDSLLSAVGGLPDCHKEELPPDWPLKSTPKGQRLLLDAIDLAMRPDGSCPTVGHVLLALLQDEDNGALALLLTLGVDSESLRQSLIENTGHLWLTNDSRDA